MTFPRRAVTGAVLLGVAATGLTTLPASATVQWTDCKPEGKDDPADTTKTGLKQFEAIDDISIVAAPGSTWHYKDPQSRDDANSIMGLLIAHAMNMRYRVAVLDCAQDQTISDVRKMRAKIDKGFAQPLLHTVRGAGYMIRENK